MQGQLPAVSEEDIWYGGIVDRLLPILGSTLKTDKRGPPAYMYAM